MLVCGKIEQMINEQKGFGIMLRLIGMVGTNSKKSTNRQLLTFIQEHFKERSNIELMEINQLPLFNKPQNREVPEIVKEMAAKIEAADGVIIATPEYDHTIPASLTNALAWLSYGIYPLLDKPVMIIGASYGTLGSLRAQAHLRQILDAPEIKARIMPSSEFMLGHSLQAFDENGQLKDQVQINLLENLFKDFEVFVTITKHLMNAHQINQSEVENFDWNALEEG